MSSFNFFDLLADRFFSAEIKIS